MKMRLMALSSLVVLAAQATAGIVSTTGPATNIVEGRGRWGASGFEGALYSNGSNAGSQMNPVGSPIWTTGVFYTFSMTFTRSTGVSTFSIDFNRDGDYLDSNEIVTRTDASLINRDFDRVKLHLQGESNANGTNDIEMQAFNVNGTNLGDFTTLPAGAPTIDDQYFMDDSGTFGDITATGSFRFSGTGAFAQERPNFHVELGNAIVPLPPAAWAGMSSLAGVAAIGFIRRRKHLA